MIGRRRSLWRETNPNLTGPFFVSSEDDVASEKPKKEPVEVDWTDQLWMKRLLGLGALLCVLSVSLNTRKTFELFPLLRPTTFICDLIITLLFTVELVTKTRGRASGLLKHLSGHDGIVQKLFGVIMLFFLWISIILHVFELTASSEWTDWISYLRILRAPLPLIMLRFIGTFFEFSLPKNRIKQIFKRSGQQFFNVTLFFVFFLVLYGLLGVQLFGELHNRCVVNNVGLPHTENSLRIADTSRDAYCSMDSDYGYQCPAGTVCMKMKDPRYKSGFNGFDEIATSIFTVYQVFSLDGWVSVMDRAVDSLPSWRAFLYFPTMIFFLSWLIKNIFIAVVTETFSEIRVQFQHTWGHRGPPAHVGVADVHFRPKSLIITGDDLGWRMELPPDDKRLQYRTVRLLLPVLNSTAFQLMVMVSIVANSIITATMSFENDGRPRSDFYQNYYYVEIGFTVFFNLEALLKMWCMGFKNFYGECKFELILAVGTTLHLIPQFYLTFLTAFQVLRLVRLVKASLLFGPGKKLHSYARRDQQKTVQKLGTLILFTMCLLIITSAISMQLFSFMDDFSKFETFPKAFMSMFQILTQEGWVEIMDETMLRTNGVFLKTVVAVIFILYHFFFATIVMSFFVAVILDNLEMDEDMKREKQMKSNVQRAETKKTLPRRLTIFEKFPKRPKMATLPYVEPGFKVPKIQDSFMRQFMYGTDQGLPTNKGNKNETESQKAPLLHLLNKNATPPSNTNPNAKQQMLAALIRESESQRLLMGNSRPISSPGTGQLNFRGSGKTKLSSKEHFKNEEKGDKVAAKVEPGTVRQKTGATNRTSTSRIDPEVEFLQTKLQEAEIERTKKVEELKENHPYFDTPLFLVPRDGQFRHLCQLVVSYAKYGKCDFISITYLDWLMIAATTVSCAHMMFEKPSNRFSVVEFAIVFFMGLEMALKILGNGLIFTPKALFKDVGGIFDFFTFAVGFMTLCWMPHEVPNNSWAQFLLVLRCFRPLRFFTLVPQMKKVVSELCRGFKEILLVSILLFVFLFVFASYGVQLYGGRLARCNDVEIKTRDECVGVSNRSISETLAPGEDETDLVVSTPRVWSNPRRFNFDNIGSAMLTLFEVLSFKGWLEIRDVFASTFEAAGVVYIHIFVFLGCIIGLKLFVGVVIANYSESKGTAILTVDQRRWCDLKKRLKIVRPLHLPRRPKFPRYRASIYDIIRHVNFNRFMVLMTILNSTLLSFSWHQEDQSTTLVLATISFCLNFVFLAEVSMKMIAFTPHVYWKSARNRYDILLAFTSIIWAILNYTMANHASHWFGVIIIILRFFSLTGKHATLEMLMLTVFVSVYKSFFIIVGMFLLIFVYALIGHLLFGTVQYGEGIGSAINGVILLFRIVTGDDWPKIMHDYMLAPPSCKPDDGLPTCGNYTAALIFFCSFYVFIPYIVLNLLVAIIMENFSIFYSKEEEELLSHADLCNFQNTWNIVDFNQRGVIPVKNVKILLRLLKGRLEVDLQRDRILFKHMCFELERLHNGGDVSFNEVLNMLSYRSVDIRKALQLDELVAREDLEYFIEEEVAKQTIRNWLTPRLKRIKMAKVQAEKEYNNVMNGFRTTYEQLLKAEIVKAEMEMSHALGAAGGIKGESIPSAKGIEKRMEVRSSESAKDVSGQAGGSSKIQAEEKSSNLMDDYEQLLNDEISKALKVMSHGSGAVGGTMREFPEVKETVASSGKQRPKGSATRPDSLNSVSGQGGGPSKQIDYKERLGIPPNSKKRPAQPSSQVGRRKTSSLDCLRQQMETRPETRRTALSASVGLGNPITNQAGFPHSILDDASLNWLMRSSSDPPPLLAPSSVKDIHEWWVKKLLSRESSDDS